MNRTTRLPVLEILLLFLGAGLPCPLTGLQGEPALGPGSAEASWNSARVLELVERGRLARQRITEDGGLATYQALVQGHVYFFLEPDAGERLLIRVDQIAVELGWEAPDRLRQRIVGERSENRLPVQEFQYYLDRLTLVEHGFGDEIRVGSGLDVARVPHPLAGPAEGAADPSPYEFRLGDSLSMTLPSRADPLKVYEIEVRPREPSRPGVIGTITLEDASASIVRMAVTFTPASYVDPRTDRIHVALDYGLWEDRFWLPNLQQIDVRREIPEVDIGVGTVIRSVLRTGGYVLNEPLPAELLGLASVTALPRDVRRTYEFTEGLYANVTRDGLAELVVDPDIRALRARAREGLREAAPSGLSPIRLHLPRLSSALRYSRAEGLFVGLGVSAQPEPALRARTAAGIALGGAGPQLSVAAEVVPNSRWVLRSESFIREIHDLGLAPGSAPIVSSLGGATRGEDFQDPVFSSGARVRASFSPDPTTAISVGIGIEAMRTPDLSSASAPWGGSRPLRPIRPIDDGDFLRVRVGVVRELTWPGEGRGGLELSADVLQGDPGSGVGISGEAEGRWGPPSGTSEFHALAKGWSWRGDPLAQGHRLLGGRGTIPGFPFRSIVGRTAAMASVVASTDVAGPLLRLRAGLHGGWADGASTSLESSWSATSSGGLLGSFSIGVGLPWDLLRLDAARGLSGGEWQLLFSIDPRWWDRL